MVARTQPAPAPPPMDPLLQLMMTQPSIEVTSNIQVSASFDPPTVRPGEKSIYRVTLNALTDSVEWPEKLPAPAELGMRFSARGQILIPTEAKLKPQTAINYHVRPMTEGSYSVPGFQIQVYGRKVMVPAASLVVSAQAAAIAPQLLQLELTQTNVYVGQPVNLRALMKATGGNIVQGMHDLHLTGEGFLVDQATARQSITMLPQASGSLPAYIYETMLSPLQTGELTISAQGFTAGNRFSGPIIIQGQVTIPGGPPQFLLIDSDPLVIKVRPLPRAGELPGFTGAFGHFILNPPQLSINRTRVGELVKLYVTFQGDGNLARLVPPPPPEVSNWQVFAATPGGSPTPAAPIAAGSVASFTFTMIPLSENVTATPAIPFSYFDPDRGVYVDLSIPPVPITVLAGTSTVDAKTFAALTHESVAEEKKLRLSDVTEDVGWMAASLTPLQRRGWFIGVQLLPLVGFLGLWQWSRHRLFLEQHPEILRRRRARRELKRERRKLKAAAAAADEPAFTAAAIRALQVAVAPHHAAEPRALVSKDVLDALNGNPTGREIVQRFFAASDATLFSTTASEPRSLLKLQPELERLLNELEAKL